MKGCYVPKSGLERFGRLAISELEPMVYFCTMNQCGTASECLPDQAM